MFWMFEGADSTETHLKKKQKNGTSPGGVGGILLRISIELS